MRALKWPARITGGSSASSRFFALSLQPPTSRSCRVHLLDR
jgi:hypothetical protein